MLEAETRSERTLSSKYRLFFTMASWLTEECTTGSRIKRAAKALALHSDFATSIASSMRLDSGSGMTWTRISHFGFGSTHTFTPTQQLPRDWQASKWHPRPAKAASRELDSPAQHKFGNFVKTNLFKSQTMVALIMSRNGGDPPPT